MTALRDTRSLRWQAALARLSARQRAVAASRPPVCYSPPANGLDAIHAMQAAYLVRDAIRYDRRNTPDRRWKRWALEAFREAYLYLPFRCKQLPAPPQQETRPFPEEAPAILTVDFAARALVQHPDVLIEELAAAAQVSDLPGLAGFPRGAQQQQRASEGGSRGEFRAPVAADPSRVTPPKGIGAIIQDMDPLPTRIFRTRTSDDDIQDDVGGAPELVFVRWTDQFLFYREAEDGEMERSWSRQTVQDMLRKGTLSIRGTRPVWASRYVETDPETVSIDELDKLDMAVDTLDVTDLPAPYRFATTHYQTYLLHPALLAQEDGRLLVAVSLNGEPPRRVATRQDVRGYLIRVKAVQAKRDALRQAA